MNEIFLLVKNSKIHIQVAATVVAVKLILQAFVNNEYNVLLSVKINLGDPFGEATSWGKIGSKHLFVWIHMIFSPKQEEDNMFIYKFPIRVAKN